MLNKIDCDRSSFSERNNSYTDILTNFIGYEMGCHPLPHKKQEANHRLHPVTFGK